LIKKDNVEILIDYTKNQLNIIIKNKMAQLIQIDNVFKKEYIITFFKEHFPYQYMLDFKIEVYTNEEIDDIYNLVKNSIPNETNNGKVLFLYARYYQFVEKNYIQMKIYLLRSADNGFSDAYNCYGAHILNVDKNIADAKTYFKIGAALNNSNCFVNLSEICKNKGKKDKQQMYLEKAIEIDENLFAIRNLAIYYKNENDNELFKRYIKMGIRKNDRQSIYAYGMHYLKLKNIDKAIKYFRMGAELNEMYCLNQLSYIYTYIQRDLDKINEYTDKSLKIRINSDALFFKSVWAKLNNNDYMSMMLLDAAYEHKDKNDNIVNIEAYVHRN
jgi:tetratricopeptide (TPR) repeat protein